MSDTDVVRVEVKGNLLFQGRVTSEPMIAIASDGTVLTLPAGTPIPDWNCIQVHTEET